MKFLNFDRVLCLAPHPDDVEYAMMGTIRKYLDTHFDIFCMTVGGQFDETSDRPRHQEVINVWENVDANVPSFPGVKYTLKVFVPFVNVSSLFNEML